MSIVRKTCEHYAVYGFENYLLDTKKQKLVQLDTANLETFQKLLLFKYIIYKMKKYVFFIYLKNYEF